MSSIIYKSSGKNSNPQWQAPQHPHPLLKSEKASFFSAADTVSFGVQYIRIYIYNIYMHIKRDQTGGISYLIDSQRKIISLTNIVSAINTYMSDRSFAVSMYSSSDITPIRQPIQTTYPSVWPLDHCNLIHISRFTYSTVIFCMKRRNRFFTYNLQLIGVSM